MYTVDIDTGGTMTDGLVWDGTNPSAMITVKVDTTPHDLVVSFRELLSEAARQLGHTGLQAFLDEVALIRWSSTITSNALGERKGAKLGLLVQPGSERSLYGDGPSPAVGTLVAERNVVGVDPGANGQAVLEAVRRLLEDGARRICVSLDSFPETSQEQAVKRIVETQYRDHYLGSVPVLLASDMAQVDDGQTRTHYALINAYVHGQLANALFTAEDLLRPGRCSAPTPLPGTPGGTGWTGWSAWTWAGPRPRPAWWRPASPATPGMAACSASRSGSRWPCCGRRRWAAAAWSGRTAGAG